MSKRGDPSTRTWAPGPEAIRFLLAQSDILKTAPREAVDALSTIAVPKGLARGDTLWTEGSTNHFAIVCRGRLEIWKDDELLDFVLEHQALGHSALLGRQHTATVIAAIDSHVLRFDALAVFNLAQQCFPLMVAFYTDTLSLVSKLNKDISSSKKSLRHRLRHRLRWLSRGKRRTTIEISHKQLAALTGSTHWSISRELKEMEDVGAIRRGTESIDIVDMDLDTDDKPEE